MIERKQPGCGNDFALAIHPALALRLSTDQSIRLADGGRSEM